ncbi:MAG: NINE protein [Flavobacteriales bacterium]
MRLFSIAVLILLFLLPSALRASEDPNPPRERFERLIQRIRAKEGLELNKVTRDSSDSVAIPHSHPKRGIAIALTILLGPIGGHRLYLGTEPRVPVLYTVTLGGGLGLLPLIDLIHLIVAEDMESYLNNRKVFMWLKKKKKGEEEE